MIDNIANHNNMNPSSDKPLAVMIDNITNHKKTNPSLSIITARGLAEEEFVLLWLVILSIITARGLSEEDFAQQYELFLC
jgi:hypothetical protein